MRGGAAATGCLPGRLEENCARVRIPAVYLLRKFFRRERMPVFAVYTAYIVMNTTGRIAVAFIIYVRKVP